MQFKNAIFTNGLLVGACIATAVPEAQPLNLYKLPLISKRACNEDGYAKCTQACQMGPGGALLGCWAGK
ncbi:uncharacterized protein B0J16DRAFT_410512 [Fusarium flagelliforme]|uniref:uncharacterized protein n=1 Tax=Fusarium flagelliforme TaxID=2675880 RepID=UPI001E8E732A|nr:uncharacterized protein B0J16DRAFT_410512 [Fusarium flagelliforme]KAH7191701.1 hypothetical protein B0J16DRAFT_410512 [Fusarium flagelliforme]